MIDYDNWELKRRDKLRMLGLSDTEQTFDNYKCPPGDKKVKKAFESLALGTTDKPFLLCYGGVGNGKTHLIKATIIEFYNRGITAKYRTVAEWMNLLRFHIEPPSGYEKLPEYLTFVVRRPIIIFDDYGVENETDWTTSQMEYIINYRYDRELITVMATNKNIDDLPDRIRSRFSDSRISQLVLNKAEDYRTLKGTE